MNAGTTESCAGLPVAGAPLAHAAAGSFFAWKSLTAQFAITKKLFSAGQMLTVRRICDILALQRQRVRGNALSPQARLLAYIIDYNILNPMKAAGMNRVTLDRWAAHGLPRHSNWSQYA